MIYSDGINTISFEMYSNLLVTTYNYYLNSVLTYSAAWTLTTEVLQLMILLEM